MATFDATERRAAPGIVAGKGDAANVKVLVSTVEVTTGATGRTINFGKIPSNARILPQSKVYWDDLATSGSPDLDIGLAAVDSNITSDADAINDGLDISAAGSADLIKDIANAGLPAWDFVNGQSSDPGGALEVQGLITTAAINQAGTVTLALMYEMD